MADVAHRAAVDEQVAAGHGAVPVEAGAVEADGVAVLAQEEPVAGDAHGGGQPDVVGHVAVLAVHGDEELGPGDRHQHGQLALAGVAADVDASRPPSG